MWDVALHAEFDQYLDTPVQRGMFHRYSSLLEQVLTWPVQEHRIGPGLNWSSQLFLDLLTLKYI